MGEVSAQAGGLVVALCAGHRCKVLLRDSGDGGLAAAISRSTGGILISAECLQQCARGAVAAVALRDSGTTVTGPSVWLGGIESAEKAAALREWVEHWRPEDQEASSLPISLADSVLGVGPPVSLESGPP